VPSCGVFKSKQHFKTFYFEIMIKFQELASTPFNLLKAQMPKKNHGNEMQAPLRIKMLCLTSRG
jgi:hypothetical protein